MSAPFSPSKPPHVLFFTALSVCSFTISIGYPSNFELYIDNIVIKSTAYAPRMTIRPSEAAPKSYLARTRCALP